MVACLRETPAKQWTKTMPPSFLPLSINSRHSSRWSSRFWDWLSRRGTVSFFSLELPGEEEAGEEDEEEEGIGVQGCSPAACWSSWSGSGMWAGLLKSRGLIPRLMSERRWVTAAAAGERRREESAAALDNTAAASVMLPMYKPSLTFLMTLSLSLSLFRSSFCCCCFLPSSSAAFLLLANRLCWFQQRLASLLVSYNPAYIAILPLGFLSMGFGTFCFVFIM